MNALKPRPPFQVLIMSEESRLGREQIETAYALKQIMDAGVRVFFYLEDRERTLDSAMDKVMLSLTNFAAEVERERASQRVYDAARQRAGAGEGAGAKIYGNGKGPVPPARIGPDGNPTLGIVSETLWEAVQARRRRRREAIPRTLKGKLLGRPSWRDGHSDYLLPGFASCVVCGGPIRTVHEKHGTHGTGHRVTVR